MRDVNISNQLTTASVKGILDGNEQSKMNGISEKSGDPMWKLVHKGDSPASDAQNLR